MVNIKSIEINQFRGIKKLNISNFSDINLIVGDNNSGKTTFLEAIQLLFARDLNSIKSIINQRTTLNLHNSHFYTSFIKMFNIEQNKEQLDLDIYATGDSGSIELEIRGYEKIISGEAALRNSNMSLREKNYYKGPNAFIPDTAKMFTGNIISQIGEQHPIEKGICFTSLDNLTSSLAFEKKIQYIPSFGHLRFDLLQNIVDNPEYKKLAISILKQFDENIEDICYTKADDGTFLESIVTKNGTIMPFSVYGDGIKKILYILNKLLASSDSILLIDEIETGLHKKYYEMLFPVIFALANKLNVQLFIATHNIEVIDAILKYGNYENNANLYDPIKVITLKKVNYDNNESNIIARNVSGKYVYDNRKVFEFEVRL